MPCDLDKGPEVEPVYYQGPDFWAATCRTCHVPMLCTHACTMDTPEELLVRMRDRAREVGRQVYGEGKFRIDEAQREIKIHRHLHVRPLGQGH